MKKTSNASKQIRAAALDLDGTLLRDDKSFSPRTIKAVRALTTAGIIPIVATGRCVDSALQYYQELGITAPLICCNGARVVDGSTGDVLAHFFLGDPLCRELVSCSRDFGIPLHAYMDGKLYFEPDHADADIHDADARYRGISVNFDDIPELRFTKVMFIGDAEKLDRIKHRLSVRNGDLLHMVYTYFNYFEVMDGRAGKQQALKYVLDYLGISPDETLAIGDAENDIEMITWVSHGVAMGNAPDEVQSAAASIAKTNEQDGAALYLEQFFSLNHEPQGAGNGY